MKYLIAFLLSFSTLPAFADTTYLIQQPGATYCTDSWQGPQPDPGQNCPPGSLWCIWTIINGDTYPGNYQATVDHTEIYVGPRDG